MRQKILDHINKTVEPVLVLDQNLTAEAVKNWTLQKEILKSNFSDDFDIRKEIDKRKATIAETLLRPCVGCRFCGVVSDRSFYVTQNTTAQVIHLHPKIIESKAYVQLLNGSTYFELLDCSRPQLQTN